MQTKPGPSQVQPNGSLDSGSGMRRGVNSGPDPAPVTRGHGDRKLVRLEYLLVLVFLAGFLIVGWRGRRPVAIRSSDELIYVSLSRSLEAGSYRDSYLVSSPWHTRYPPGYPAWLVPMRRVTGETLDGIILGNQSGFCCSARSCPTSREGQQRRYWGAAVNWKSRRLSNRSPSCLPARPPGNRTLMRARRWNASSRRLEKWTFRHRDRVRGRGRAGSGGTGFTPEDRRCLARSWHGSGEDLGRAPGERHPVVRYWHLPRLVAAAWTLGKLAGRCAEERPVG